MLLARPPYKKFIIITVFIFLCKFSFSQQTEIQVSLQIKITQFGITGLNKHANPVFKFFLNNENGRLLNKYGICYKFYSKEGIAQFTLPDPKYIGLEPFLDTISVPILSRPSISLVMECYDNNKGEECTFDKKDEAHSITTKVINLNTYTPGDISDTIRIADEQGRFYSIIQLKYTLIRPGNIQSATVLQPINPVDKTIQLFSEYPLVNNDKLLFVWEYSPDLGTTWNRLAVSMGGKSEITINPLKDLFGNKLISGRQIMFRLRANSRDTLAISDTLSTFFTPIPPVFAKEDVKVMQTCGGGYTDGAIHIANIQSQIKTVGYILRKTENSKEFCSLTNPISEGCSGLVKVGTTDSGIVEIKNLASGNYTLLLINSQEGIGNVCTSYGFEIPTFPDLKIKNISVINPNCNNSKGGQISVEAEGGTDINLWQIALTPGQNTLETKDKQFTFKNLEDGTYQFELQDGCGKQFSKSFTLKTPGKPEIDFIKIETNPELVMIINLKNGGGRYRVVFFDKDKASKTQQDSSAKILLPIWHKGTWNIQIIDESDPGCLTLDTIINVVYHKGPSDLPLNKINKFFSINKNNQENNFGSINAHFSSSENVLSFLRNDDFHVTVSGKLVQKQKLFKISFFKHDVLST